MVLKDFEDPSMGVRSIESAQNQPSPPPPPLSTQAQITDSSTPVSTVLAITPYHNMSEGYL